MATEPTANQWYVYPVEGSQDVYYYNAVTGETSWTLPEGASIVDAESLAVAAYASPVDATSTAEYSWPPTHQESQQQEDGTTGWQDDTYNVQNQHPASEGVDYAGIVPANSNPDWTGAITETGNSQTNASDGAYNWQGASNLAYDNQTDVWQQQWYGEYSKADAQGAVVQETYDLSVVESQSNPQGEELSLFANLTVMSPTSTAMPRNQRDSVLMAFVDPEEEDRIRREVNQMLQDMIEQVIIKLEGPEGLVAERLRAKKQERTEQRRQAAERRKEARVKERERKLELKRLADARGDDMSKHVEKRSMSVIDAEFFKMEIDIRKQNREARVERLENRMETMYNWKRQAYLHAQLLARVMESITVGSSLSGKLGAFLDPPNDISNEERERLDKERQEEKRFREERMQRWEKIFDRLCGKDVNNTAPEKQSVSTTPAQQSYTVGDVVGKRSFGRKNTAEDEEESLDKDDRAERSEGRSMSLLKEDVIHVLTTDRSIQQELTTAPTLMLPEILSQHWPTEFLLMDTANPDECAKSEFVLFFTVVGDVAARAEKVVRALEKAGLAGEVGDKLAWERRKKKKEEAMQRRDERKRSVASGGRKKCERDPNEKDIKDEEEANKHQHSVLPDDYSHHHHHMFVPTRCFKNPSTIIPPPLLEAFSHSNFRTENPDENGLFGAGESVFCAICRRRKWDEQRKARDVVERKHRHEWDQVLQSLVDSADPLMLKEMILETPSRPVLTSAPPPSSADNKDGEEKTKATKARERNNKKTEKETEPSSSAERASASEQRKPDAKKHGKIENGKGKKAKLLNAHDETWLRVKKFKDLLQYQENNRQNMQMEEERERVRIEYAIRKLEQPFLSIQEKSHRDFVTLLSRCIGVAPALRRLQWERTLIPGQYQMTLLATDSVNGEKYVVHTLACETEQDAVYVEKEAKTIQSIRSPFLVAIKGVYRHVYQVFAASGLAVEKVNVTFILQEYCTGPTLAHLIGTSHRGFSSYTQDSTTYTAVEKWIHQLSSGLSSMHSKKCAHRNISPSSIIISGDGNAKLGCYLILSTARVQIISSAASVKLAIAATGERSEAEVTTPELLSHPSSGIAPASIKGPFPKLCGDVTYVAPESWDTGLVSMSGDIWALGCVAFTMLTGKLPSFGGRRLEHIIAEVAQKSPSHGTIAPDGPTLSRDIIEQRPQTILAMLRMTLQHNPGARTSAIALVNYLSSKLGPPVVPLPKHSPISGEASDNTLE